jgi:hypothetical protein
VDHLGVADQLEGGQPGGPGQLEGVDAVLVALDGRQDQVADPVHIGQPLGQLAGLGQVEADAPGLAADLAGHGRGPPGVAARQHHLAAPAGVVAGHLQPQPLGAADHDHASRLRHGLAPLRWLLRRAGSAGTPSRG